MVSFSPIFHNSGLPIDANLDGRTAPDDETDGILNAPRITDAFYDPATEKTTIRGVVRLRAGVFGTTFGIVPYIAFNTRGDIAEVLPSGSRLVEPPAGGSAGDVPFEIVVHQNLRGSFVALQTFVAEAVVESPATSEISEGVLVR